MLRLMSITLAYPETSFFMASVRGIAGYPGNWGLYSSSAVLIPSLSRFLGLIFPPFVMTV